MQGAEAGCSPLGAELLPPEGRICSPLGPGLRPRLRFGARQLAPAALGIRERRLAELAVSARGRAAARRGRRARRRRHPQGSAARLELPGGLLKP